MSFTSETKQTLCALTGTKACCKSAELYGLLAFGNVFEKTRIKYITENRSLAELIVRLLDEEFSVHPNLYRTEKKSKSEYSEEGQYLGITSDLVMENFTATKLVTDTGKVYSAAAIAALGDAVILKKEPYFPLGMLVNSDIPASPEPIREGTLVNRGTLRTAIASGRLIRLTVNLLPLPYRRADL